MSQRQHYVPQFYLRGWSTGGEGLVWVYRKGEPPRRVSIRKVGQELDFYAFTDNTGVYDNESVEKELEKLDTAAAPVIRRARERMALTTADRQLLSRFISVLWRRVPQHRETVNNMLKEMMPAYFEQLKADLVALRTEGNDPERIEKLEREVSDIEEMYMEKVPDYFFTNNLRRASNFEDLLNRMDWAFLEAPPGTPFLTSDAPVVSNIRGTGLGDTQNGIVLFPLSQNLMLQGMWVTTFRSAYVPIADVDARRFNRYVVEIAHLEVYASIKSAGFVALVDKWLKDTPAE